METETKHFNQSFIKVAVESATKIKEAEAARTRVSETTLVSTHKHTLDYIVSGGPPETNNNWKTEEATKQQSPDGSRKQKPSEMESDRRLPATEISIMCARIKGAVNT